MLQGFSRMIIKIKTSRITFLSPQVPFLAPGNTQLLFWLVVVCYPNTFCELDTQNIPIARLIEWIKNV